MLVGIVMIMVMPLNHLWTQAYTRMTTSGEMCVFPFVWMSVSYVICTDVNNSGTAWCATETNAYNIMIGNKWGNCGRYYLITYIFSECS